MEMTIQETTTTIVRKARKMEYEFMLQIVTDGSVTYSKKYDNAIDAVKAYERVVDYGFAHYWLEAVLVEPSGKAHSKTFQTPYGIPSTVK
jgi:hypothetical protein